MRIVQLVDNMGYGGLQQVVICLALGLRERGHEVEIACLRKVGNHDEAIEQLNHAGVEVTSFHKPAGFSVGTLRRLGAYLKAGRADVIHSHNPLIHHYAAGAGRIAGVRAVVNTLHAIRILEQIGGQTKMMYWLAGMQGGRICSVCAEADAALRRRYRFPSKRLAVVDNGIDLSRYLTVTRPAPQDELVFGTVGRMTSVKNHHGLIQAFAAARAKHPHIRLRLLGGGKLETSLRQLTARLNVTDSVEFCGYSHDVPGFLAGLHVFVLPSDSEAMPLSLLEAIAAGLPVIATAVGGVPGIVKKTESGWLCPRGDTPALAAAMEQAIAAPWDTGKIERSRQAVAGYYSVPRMTADYERVYEGLM